MPKSNVIITEHGVRIKNGRVQDTHLNLDPFQRLALQMYPKLYVVDKHNTVRKIKNKNYADRLQNVRKKHELGRPRVSKPLV